MEIKIFTEDVKSYLKEATKDDDKILENFQSLLESHSSASNLVAVAYYWDLYKNSEKHDIAYMFSGHYHLGRFITLMDYLSDKISEELEKI